MDYCQLGQSNRCISRICLGCMGFGETTDSHPWTLNEEESRQIIKRALDLGINFFDTAMSYGGGTSEEFLGRAIRDFAERDQVVIATKFLPRSQAEIAAGVSGQKHVLDCLEKSLKRLEMDYIDLYILHMWDYHTPIEDILEGLNQAVQSGKVKAIGISNCYAWQLAKANMIAEQNGWAKFTSVQGHYNLIFREEEREMLPYCEEEKLAFTPYSSLASGRLVKETDEVSNRLNLDEIAKSKYDRSKEKDSIIIQRVAEVAHHRGFTRTQVALAWLLSKTTSPIIGATKIKHIEDAVAAVGVTLTEEEIQYLEEPYQPHPLVGVMAFNKK